jgi:8-oxo-dGTP pyrophosphatase MutT (NUDIX family)
MTIKSKLSYGIILTTKDKRGNYKFLMVQRRYTYAFFDIVCSKRKLEHLSELLRQVTMDELLILYSFNFDAAWYKIWVKGGNNYELYKEKYTSMYLGSNLEKYKALISGIIPTGELIWEIPKGRKIQYEYDIDAAVREFYEETCIKRSQYNIISNATRTMTYINDGIKYVNKYYFAIADDLEVLMPTTLAIDYHGEIHSCKFMSFDELHFSKVHNNVVKFLKIAKVLVKKYYSASN